MAKTSKNNPKSSAKQTQKNSAPNVSVRIDALFNNEDSHTRAIASANIGGAFAIHRIAVIEGKNGLFVSMPQTSYTNDKGEKKYADLFHPITAEAHEALQTEVLDKYHEAVEQSQSASEAETEEIEEIEDEDEGLEPSM